MVEAGDGEARSPREEQQRQTSKGSEKFERETFDMANAELPAERQVLSATVGSASRGRVSFRGGRGGFLKWKVKCRYYLQGRCLKGASCAFSHAANLQEDRRGRQPRRQEWIPRLTEGEPAKDGVSSLKKRDAAVRSLDSRKADESASRSVMASSSTTDGTRRRQPRRNARASCGSAVKEMPASVEANEDARPERSVRACGDLPKEGAFSSPSNSSLPAITVDIEKIERLYARSFRWLFCKEPLRSQLLERRASLVENSSPSCPQLAKLSSSWRSNEGTLTLAKCQAPPPNSQSICAFRVVLKPSDPKFDHSLLPDGLLLEVAIHKSYEESLFRNDQSSNSAEEWGATKKVANARVARIQVMDQRLSDDLQQRVVTAFDHILGELKTKEQAAAAERKNTKSFRPSPPLVFTALKALDRSLPAVVSNPESSEAALSAPFPWTLEEQRKLEEAIIFFRKIPDVALRWKKISAYVGSRSVKECAIRFKKCREHVLEKQQQQQQQTQVSRQLGSQREAAAAAEDGCVEGGRVEAEEASTSEARSGDALQDSLKSSDQTGSVPVSLLNATTEGVAAFYLMVLAVQVSCARCQNFTDVRLAFPLEGETLDSTGCSTECVKCKLRISLHATPLIAHSGKSTEMISVALLKPREATVRDLLPCDFALTCFACGGLLKVREVQSGGRRTNTCRHCHAKVCFGFEAASVGLAVVKGRQTEGRDATEAVPRRKKATAPAIRLGTPLTDFGICKHYKKSFRWLRFPCCGKAYPCDVCHDLAEDHDHEWALRMICGFCSLEQPFAAEKVCVCGKALTKGGGTSHWEGGKGCRDATRMSKKDSRKFKLLSKQSRAAAPATKH